MSDKRKRAARAIMAETGMNYTAALREADRRHAEARAGEHSPVPGIRTLTEGEMFALDLNATALAEEAACSAFWLPVPPAGGAS